MGKIDGELALSSRALEKQNKNIFQGRRVECTARAKRLEPREECLPWLPYLFCLDRTINKLRVVEIKPTNLIIVGQFVFKSIYFIYISYNFFF